MTRLNKKRRKFEIKNPRSREMETFPLSGFLQEKAQLKTHRGEKHFHTHTELGANKSREVKRRTLPSLKVELVCVSENAGCILKAEKSVGNQVITFPAEREKSKLV